MKYLVWLPVAVLALTACNQKEDHAKRHAAMLARVDSLRHDLLKTDLAFSEMSEQKGRNAAFIAYADSNATFLRPNHMPITGKDTMASLLADHPDTGIVLTWVPIKADVARSGDLGYTYGTYRVVIKGIGAEEGTYCTVWKRDKEHGWKFVLDTGNEGLKAADKAEEKMIKAEEKKESGKAKPKKKKK
jgi:ketosteroid isomerase-like protein